MEPCARAQYGPQDMERKQAAALHSWARQHAWLLLNFFPFPVGHPEHEHCIVAERERRASLLSFGFLPSFLPSASALPFWPFLPSLLPPLAFPANPVKVIMIESGNIAQGRRRTGGRAEGEFAAHPPKIPVYLLDTDTKM